MHHVAGEERSTKSKVLETGAALTQVRTTHGPRALEQQGQRSQDGRLEENKNYFNY